MGLGLSALLSGSSQLTAQAPPLGAARDFAVLGGSTVTSTGTTFLGGDLGVSPGTGITGFPPGILSGTIHAGDALSLQAQNDLTAAYDFLKGAACTVVMTGADLGGLTLTPGVYCFAASAPLNGALTLDAQGDPDAVFIFQIGSTLLAAIDSSVQVINGAQANNVFWQVGSSATLAAGTSFTGNVVALSSITLSVGSSVSGRALARNGAVTMDNASVSAPVTSSCGAPASVVELLSGCVLSSTPILSCTLPVTGEPVQIHLDGSVASVHGYIRLSPYDGRSPSLHDCHVYRTASSFVLARFVTDANGDVAIGRSIPTDSSLCGTSWVIQGLIRTPAGPRTLAVSNALLLTLGS